MVLKEFKVPQAHKETQVHKALKAQQEPQVLKVMMVLQDHKAHKVQQEIQVLKDI